MFGLLYVKHILEIMTFTKVSQNFMSAQERNIKTVKIPICGASSLCQVKLTDKSVQIETTVIYPKASGITSWSTHTPHPQKWKGG